MLVLSRKKNQQIMIGESVKLIVIAVHGERVKLGFIAPNNVPIYREEVHQRMQSANDQLDVVSSTGLSSIHGRVTTRKK